MQTSFKSDSKNTQPARTAEQPWLSSPLWDLTWIMGPAFITASTALIFKSQMEACPDVPLWVWVSCILLVDVAHVYASLYRTYLDPQALQKNKALLLFMPLAAWFGGYLLYCLGDQVFWRGLLYLAVFHFIRQQFGFMMMYARKDPPQSKKFGWLDRAAIYTATLYPLIYWHTHTKDFLWFGATEFIEGIPAACNEIGLLAYICVAIAYIVKEILLAKEGHFNVPKNLILLVTAYSWWTCIVAVNSDLAFTITNVVSHGVPYMALVWLYHGRGSRTVLAENSPWKQGWRKLLVANAVIFVAFMGLLAYIEEGFWDTLVWREHHSVFAAFWQIPHISDPAILALVVPFLALPQSTHYLLDGFIWRIKQRGNVWSA